MGTSCRINPWPVLGLAFETALEPSPLAQLLSLRLVSSLSSQERIHFYTPLKPHVLVFEDIQ